MASPAGNPGSGQSTIVDLYLDVRAVRLALFPFHAWLPIVARHGTVAVGIVFLVGAKVGIYAVLRWVFPLLPDAAQQWDTGVIALGLAGMLYGALLAFRQNDLRRLLAFAVISQSGVFRRDQPEWRASCRAIFAESRWLTRQPASSFEPGIGGIRFIHCRRIALPALGHDTISPAGRFV